MMTETTMTLDLSVPFGDGFTLGELKESIDEFFDDREVSAETIGRIRDLIAAGHFSPCHYRDDNELTGKTTHCIRGLHAAVLFPEDTEMQKRLVTGGYYNFELIFFSCGAINGATPQTSHTIAQLDQVLALCEKERTKK